jgi:hypothetical protein
MLAAASAFIFISAILLGAASLQWLRRRRLRIRLARVDVAGPSGAEPASARECDEQESGGSLPNGHVGPIRSAAPAAPSVTELTQRARQLRDELRKAA